MYVLEFTKPELRVLLGLMRLGIESYANRGDGLLDKLPKEALVSLTGKLSALRESETWPH